MHGNILKSPLETKSMIAKAKEFTGQLIQRIQSEVGLDVLYFMKGGSVVTFFTLTYLLVSFVTNVIFTRFSDKVLYGQYQLVLTIVGTLAIFSLPRMETAIMRSVAKGNDGSFKTALKAKLTASLIGSVAMLVVAAYFHFLQQDSTMGTIFLFLALFFPFFHAFETFMSFFIAKGKLVTAYSAQLFISVFTGLAIVISLLLTRNLLIIVLSLALARTIAFAIASIFTIKSQKNKKVEKGTIKYGIQLSIFDVLPLIILYFDKLMLPLFLGVESLAIYAVALILPDLLITIIRSSQSLFFPKLVNIGQKDFMKKIQSRWYLFFIPAIAVIILSQIVIEPFFTILYPAYMESIPFARLLVFMLIANLFNVVMLNNLEAKKALTELLSIKFVYPIIQSITIFLGVLIYGVWGIIIAKILNNLIAAIMLYYLNLVLLKKRKRDIPWLSKIMSHLPS